MPAGNKGEQFTAIRGDQVTGNEGDQVTGNEGDQVTGNEGDQFTGNEGDQFAGIKEDQLAGAKGEQHAGIKGSQLAGDKGKQFAGRGEITAPLPTPMVTAAALLVGWVRQEAGWAGVIGCLAVVFVGLVVSVGVGGGVTVIDQPVLGWVVGHRSGGLTRGAIFVSDMGGTGAMAGVAAVVFAGLVWRRMWGRAGLVGVATAGAGVLVVGVKHVVGRSRPPVVDHLVVETNQSFPSGHSLGSIVVIGVLAALLVLGAGRTAVRVAIIAVAAIFVAAVGISRLYLGVHWPTDILGGWSLGGLWLVLCLVAWRPVQSVVAARLARRK